MGDEPEESLQLLWKAINIFRCFRNNYESQREKLANNVKHAPWDFPSSMIFERFDRGFHRMLQLEVRLYLRFLGSSFMVVDF